MPLPIRLPSERLRTAVTCVHLLVVVVFFPVLAAVGATGEAHPTDIAIEATATRINVGDWQWTSRRWGDAAVLL